MNPATTPITVRIAAIWVKILVKEDTAYRKWPRELKIGTGANGIALLKNVSVWYELWRNINSFPPDYYKPIKTEDKK